MPRGGNIGDLAAQMREIAARLERADGAAVVYGIRDVPHYSGMSAAELGRILFEGVPRSPGGVEVGGQRIPARNFFQDAETMIEAETPRLSARAARRIIRGVTVRQALEPLRVFCEDAIKTSIDIFMDPQNASSTIRKKGRDDPLFDRGDLLDAAGAEIED